MFRNVTISTLPAKISTLCDKKKLTLAVNNLIVNGEITTFGYFQGNFETKKLLG